MKKIIFALIVIIASLYGCSKMDIKNPSENLTDLTTGDREIILGKKLENPYSVSNMKKAYLKLKSTDSSGINLNITATHKYIRFLPQTSSEYDSLMHDKSLNIYDHPLDYEIIVIGNYYHDPSIPDTCFTWQYCAVPADYKIPDIKFELLADLFIPDSTLAISELSGNATAFLEKLEIEALKMTKNLDFDPSKIHLKAGYAPSGRIRVFDDQINNYIGLEGAKVRVRRWFETRSTHTDVNGNFHIPFRFKRPVNYSIEWEQNDYDIRNGNFVQSYYNGPKQDDPWYLDISSGASIMYATIHRAAFRYWYRNTLGIKRPPENTWYRSAIKIGAHDKDKDFNGDFAKWRNWLGWPQIRIYQYTSSGVRKTTTEILSTTFHELAHASHWDLAVKSTNRNDFVFADDIVVESWARGVQWAFMNNTYPGSNYRPQYVRGSYTGIVEDLIDGLSGNDQVTGYTMYQLEESLKGGARTFDKWRDNIRNKYDNGTENQLDLLFNSWR